MATVAPVAMCFGDSGGVEATFGCGFGKEGKAARQHRRSELEGVKLRQAAGSRSAGGIAPFGTGRRGLARWPEKYMAGGVQQVPICLFGKPWDMMNNGVFGDLVDGKGFSRSAEVPFSRPLEPLLFFDWFGWKVLLGEDREAIHSVRALKVLAAASIVVALVSWLAESESLDESLARSLIRADNVNACERRFLPEGIVALLSFSSGENFVPILGCLFIRSRSYSSELGNDDLCLELQLCCCMCPLLFLMWVFGRFPPINHALVRFLGLVLYKKLGQLSS
uniref:Uncharacterized protein n=2 Tax=Oryza punctata TaxID=4537 RepID=A0A0E0K0W4_ORYPU